MTVRFGVLGASSMVYRAVIAEALSTVDGVALLHEASASGDVSPTARRVGAATSTDYQAVLDDPDVDVVYVPLPNHLHEPWVMASAEAGKHVLCEKPLAIDAASARRMADACADAGVILLEAYMSPFHPRSVAVQRAVDDGAIGSVVHGEARMAGVLPADNHRWSVANGGGALLDIGIYCLEPVLTAFGWDGSAPSSVAAWSAFAGDGVDASTAAQLGFDHGRSLQLWVSFDAPDQQRLQLTGTEGAIGVEVRHATPDRRDAGYQLRRLDGAVEEVPTETGSCYEGLVAHTRDVLTGRAAPLRDVGRSVAVAEVLDAIADAAGHQR